MKGCEIHNHTSKHGSGWRQRLSEALMVLAVLAERTRCRTKGGREMHGKEGRERNTQDSESAESKELWGQ